MLVVLLLVVTSCFGAVNRGIAQGWAGGVVSDDTIIVGSRGGKIMSLDTANGDIKGEPIVLTAQLPTRGLCGGGGTTGVAIYSSPVLGDGLVYVGGYDGKVYAFPFEDDRLRVEERWIYPRQNDLGGVIIGDLVLIDNVIYLAASNGTVYALDAADGYKLWEYATGDKIWSSPVLADNTLLIGSFEKKFYAIDITAASDEDREQWVFETEGAITSTPIVSGNNVYFGTFGRRFYALNIESGKEVWRFPASDEDETRPNNWFWAKPLVNNGTIYAPNIDGKVYALDADTGKLLDFFDLGGAISSSPVLVDGLIIIATQDGEVYSLDTADNRQTKLASLGEKVQAPLFASDGTVYIHTFDDNLFAIDIETGASREFSLLTDNSE